MEHDLNKDRNLKLLLSTFEQTSDLKINIYKSELFCFTKAKEAAAQYIDLFGCPQGQFPFKYLGNALSTPHLCRVETCRRVLTEMFERLKMQVALRCWTTGVDQLCSHEHCSLHALIVSTFQRGPAKTEFISIFFWQGNSRKKKYGLTK